MTFELPLTEARVKPRQVIALHLMAGLVMAGCGAILSLLQSPIHTLTIGLLVAGVLLLGTALLRNKWIRQPKVNRLFRIGELMVLLCLASYLAMSKFPIPAAMCGILGAAILFAIFWEQQADSALTIHVDEQGVRLPLTSRKRNLRWPEIEQVLLRFGTLTINLKDNRMFQWTVGSIGFDKDRFEQFCSTQIEAGKLQRDPHDW
ncbi:hypothetical protein [Polluticoccus soli]|uniref:hypothetical protein n=1 Tax=Polluticoccus soli TaxID=3034150 RepID=UPI0023E34D3A|nr:hypothetical protein [Flavipsychrobacter sp. JY13-12]